MNRQRTALVAPPVVIGVVMLVAWQLVVTLGHIPQYVTPSPVAICEQIHDNFGSLLSGTEVSGLNALIGLVSGTALACVAALLGQRSRVLEGILNPLAAGAAVVPIVALAPLFYGMFTATGESPRRLVVAVVTFFPIYVNVAKGFTQVLPVHRELMQAYAASDRDIARHVLMPTAMPFLFAGLRVAAPAAVITSIVSEYFGGGQNGLASLITTAAGNSAYAQAWGYVAASVFLGLVAFITSSSLELFANRSLGTRR
jgi:NitT/TauT family transport system permease protein